MAIQQQSRKSRQDLNTQLDKGSIMTKNNNPWNSFAALLFMLFSLPACASESVNHDDFLSWQLKALENRGYAAFMKHGNRVFTELFDKHQFQMLTMQSTSKLKAGYSDEYLGSIKRLSMIEHLWRLKYNSEKYEELVSVTLANGKVVGFSLF